MLHLLFIYSYLLFGIISILYNKEVSLLYLFCLAFGSMKIIINYRVCSVAYLECKLRNIKRDKSFMNRFLDPIIDLRYTDHIYLLTPLSFYILTYNFVYLKRLNELKSII